MNPKTRLGSLPPTPVVGKLVPLRQWLGPKWQLINVADTAGQVSRSYIGYSVF